MASNTAKLDLQERVSYISSATKDKDAYAEVSTPDVEGGALRAGGAPRLFSKESFGLLVQYAAVGLVYGTLPGMIYPFLTVYLNMEGTATTSATALLSIPWSLKVFIGMMSDNFPIFGYRRRPYMILGWSVCALCLFIMAFKPMPKSYWIKPEYMDLDSEELVEGVHFRADAPDKGSIYIVLMMLASLGYLVSDVASDAVLVEYAQREPEAIRGRTQTAIYTTRTFFGIFASCIQAFLMNGAEYRGDFSFSLSFANVMLILAIFCVPVIPMTWFFVREEAVARPNFGEYIRNLWELIRSRAFYQIIAYQFFSNVFSGVTYVSSYPMQTFWVKATNLNNNLSTVFAYFIAVITMISVGKYGLHWNWRWVTAVTMISAIAIDAVVTMLVTWDVVRSQWFWLGVPLIEMVPSYIQFIVSTYVVVELAGEGNEGACYGLLTTVANLGSPFASTISKNIDAGFKVWNKDIKRDTHEVRVDVTWTIMIAYAFKLGSLLFLVLLPRQKAETQELKRNGGKSSLIGAISIFYSMFALCWSIMVNLLAIFPSTECLAITGGCHNN